MENREKDALSRRAFVSKVATTSVAGVAALVVTRQRSEAVVYHGTHGTDTVSSVDVETDSGSDVVEAPQAVTEIAPAPWALLQPLAAGSALTAGWRVSELGDIVHGSSVLTLENDKGRSQRLHICRNDGTPQGLVYTERFDLVVMNGGRGDMPTDENFGQAVAAIAHVLAGNEAKHPELMSQLLPQSAREEQFAATARLR